MFGLDFLQEVSGPPRIKVMFDLGNGGIFMSRYHHVEIGASVVSLIYDDRYEGDRFHPPFTVVGAPITISFPGSDAQSISVHNPNLGSGSGLSLAIGCLDILNLLIVPPAEERPMENRTDEELQQWRDEIPTRAPGDESASAALEQAIRSGQLDAGGAL
jgi:hypothetical protein